jgi:hypothetical protein
MLGAESGRRRRDRGAGMIAAVRVAYLTGGALRPLRLSLTWAQIGPLTAWWVQPRQHLPTQPPNVRAVQRQGKVIVSCVVLVRRVAPFTGTAFRPIGNVPPKRIAFQLTETPGRSAHEASKPVTDERSGTSRS